MDGILIVDKPADFTSFDVIAKIRGMLKTKKVGHGGTLDPMATGVLPILVGKATKTMDILPCQDKKYIAGFSLGICTDTQDITGKIIKQTDDFSVSLEELSEKLNAFTGKIQQIPPMYSAVQKDGVRLYDLARQGVEVERDPRTVTVYSIDILSYDPDLKKGELEIHCSKGTYVRTLISDIGDALGCGGVLTSLRRTMASGYTLETAITLEEAQTLTDSGKLENSLLPIESAFTSYPVVFVSQAQARRFTSGGSLDTKRITIRAKSEFYRIKYNKTFLGLGTIKAGEMSIYRLFYSGGGKFENNQ